MALYQGHTWTNELVAEPFEAQGQRHDDPCKSEIRDPMCNLRRQSIMPIKMYTTVTAPHEQLEFGIAMNDEILVPSEMRKSEGSKLFWCVADIFLLSKKCY
jgi:hypothetical protein